MLRIHLYTSLELNCEILFISQILSLYLNLIRRYMASHPLATKNMCTYPAFHFCKIFQRKFSRAQYQNILHPFFWQDICFFDPRRSVPNDGPRLSAIGPRNSLPSSKKFVSIFFNIMSVVESIFDNAAMLWWSQ